jgi:hypothetical protein
LELDAGVADNDVPVDFGPPLVAGDLPGGTSPAKAAQSTSRRAKHLRLGAANAISAMFSAFGDPRQHGGPLFLGDDVILRHSLNRR